jgi:hypothetical protein
MAGAYARLDEDADARAATFWWFLAFSALALIPAALLPRRPAVADERAGSRERRHSHWHATESG